MKKSKYGNKKVRLPDGTVYDSQKEFERHMDLLLMERAGLITNLQRQVKFILIPAQYVSYERHGKRGLRLKDGMKCVERECAYYADFVYHDAETGKRVVEDVKGDRTEGYIIKRKLMLRIHGIRILET